MIVRLKGFFYVVVMGIALFVLLYTSPGIAHLTSRKRRIHAGVLRSMKAYFGSSPLAVSASSLGINSMEGGGPGA